MSEYKIIIAWSSPAIAYANQLGFQGLIEYKGTKLKRGEDYDIKEFPSKEAFDFYIKGVEDTSNWTTKPSYKAITDNLPNEPINKIKVLLVNPLEKKITEHTIFPNKKEFSHLLGCNINELSFHFPFSRKEYDMEVVYSNELTEITNSFDILESNRRITGLALVAKSDGFGGYNSTDFTVKTLIESVKVVKD